MTRNTGNVFECSNLSSTFNQIQLTEDAQNVISFIGGDRQYTYSIDFSKTPETTYLRVKVHFK